LGLAEACVQSGNIDEGLATVEEAFAVVSTGGEQFCFPEIHCIKRELLLARPAEDSDAAEVAFDEALSVLRALQAKSKELRTSVSLARHWRDQSKHDE
jgi:hypothetical protein